MGAQQILRVAVASLIALRAAPAAPAAAQALAPSAPERIAIVELRGGDEAALAPAREPVAAALEANPVVAAIRDAALAEALLGLGKDATGARAADALAAAARAFGDLDCEAASGAADIAIEWLSRAQASGTGAGEPLRQAYAYQLLCAHNAGDTGRALIAAERMRALGDGRPEQVPQAVWDAYPDYDATANVFHAEVSVVTEPAGARVFVDHREAGTAPLALHLAEGPHVIAAGTDAASAVQRLSVEGREPHSVELALRPIDADEPDPRAQALRGWVSSWRGRGYAPTDYEITQLLEMAGARFAFALTTTEAGPRVELWGRAPHAKVASRLGAARPAQTDDLVELALDAAARWAGGVPAGPAGAPNPAERDDDNRKPWWVYASIVGAVAAGGLLILSTDLADDRQVIELRYP